MNLQIKGVDLSALNTEVDFDQAKEDSVQFAILRAGVGGVSRHEDRLFRAHMENALCANIETGAYWLTCVIDKQEARQEAKAFLSIVAEYRKHITYPLFCYYGYPSIEYAQKRGIPPNREYITDIIHTFCDEIEQSGWYAGYYANPDFIKNYLDMERLSRWDLWLADYHGGPEYHCGMQQITDCGIIRGITGDVNINVAYRTYSHRVYTELWNSWKFIPQALPKAVERKRFPAPPVFLHTEESFPNGRTF